MTPPEFDAETLATLMSPPAPGYLDRVECVRATAAASVAGGGETVRHFGRFLERVRDLDADELAELYAVSFAPADAEALRDAAGDLRRTGCDASARALPVLEGLLPPLEEARNPFAGLFKALCCLLLACRVGRAGVSVHGSPPSSSLE